MQHLDDLQQLSARLQALGAKALCVDDRKLQADDAFIAWPGYGIDARQFVAGALARGAVACVVEAQGAAAWDLNDERVYAVTGLKAQAGALAALFYGQPSAQLAVCAFTGTNGKTSSTWWLAQALEQLAAQGLSGPCGIIGTLGVGRINALRSTGLTTPDPITVQAQLQSFVAQQCSVCAVEASSIGLVEGRMQGVQVHTAILTNFTQDHLDYHGSMDAYWLAKESLFRWPNLRAAVLNADDAKTPTLLELCQARGVKTYTYSVSAVANLQAQNIEFLAQGLRFDVAYEGSVQSLQLPLYGAYNIANVLGVVATLLSLGHSFADAVAACRTLTAVPGRMELLVQAASANVVVDYAHTPDALEQSLKALRPSAAARGGKIWCIFGCGGNRDSAKRPLMGAIAERYADAVVLTSDNPRDENPLDILAAIRAGFRQAPAHIEADRARAIRWALRHAAACDVILLAGKGHEDYQEIDGVKRYFSDQAEVRKAWAEGVAA